MSSRKAAVIDMGTNTFHLLLVKISNQNFETLYKEKIPVKLGQGGINQDILAPDALERAFQTLKHFKHLIDGENIDQVFAFATSAVRNASNGNDFVREVKETLDIAIHVISGNQEAQLIYEGVKLAGALGESTQLIMDIGGGSVEFIIGTSETVFWKQSFEIGGQRLLELFHHHDPILPTEISLLNAYLFEKLEPLLQAIKVFKPMGLIGASGTFDTLTDIYFEAKFQSKQVGQLLFELPIYDFTKIHRDILTKNREARLAIAGMIPMRVDMIVVASSLIDFILHQLPVADICCSRFALKEGAVSQLLHAKQIVLE